ncbi:hypothetical protein B0H16DRAFT_1695287 [Mycena metata]|uniref:Uncharacterized protein n=1 Tax=Mycena metata TaxID=1033252 RepID=A0AAD7I909_9AGAR|nr:hypothetical protein B0H16DRAFT_1695287 [Mycena metata]
MFLETASSVPDLCAGFDKPHGQGLGPSAHRRLRASSVDRCPQESRAHLPCARGSALPQELVVSTNAMNINFNFVQIVGLEVSGLITLVDGDYDDQARLCYRLAEALQMLPASSPLLHTLQLNLEIPFCPSQFPTSAFSDLITTINLIRAPRLTTLEFSVNFDSHDFEEPSRRSFPKTYISPFLMSHPNLLHLTLSTPEAKLPTDVSFLPKLRSFKGSLAFEDAVVLFPPTTTQKLVVALIHPKHQNFWSFHPWLSEFPTHLYPTNLCVLPVDTTGSAMKMN